MGNDCCGVRRPYAKIPNGEPAPEPLLDENQADSGGQSLQTASQVQPQEVAERTEAADVSANISLASAKIRVEESSARDVRSKSVETERQKKTNEDSFEALKSMELFRYTPGEE